MSHLLAKLKKDKISDIVAIEIEKYIIKNNLQPGDCLPSQAEISKLFDVSTRSIREAIRYLESRGIVNSHQGRGVYVKNRDIDFFMRTIFDAFPLHFPHTKDLLLDLTRVRQTIEPTIIYNIALDPPDGFIEEFSNLLDQLESTAKKKKVAEYNVLDMELHRFLISGSKNIILITLYNYLSQLIINCFQTTVFFEDNLELSIKEHHKLFECILSRNSYEARDVLSNHIETTLRSLKKL